jgi:hypothetical protein
MGVPCRCTPQVCSLPDQQLLACRRDCQTLVKRGRVLGKGGARLKVGDKVLHSDVTLDGEPLVGSAWKWYPRVGSSSADLHDGARGLQMKRRLQPIQDQSIGRMLPESSCQHRTNSLTS